MVSVLVQDKIWLSLLIFKINKIIVGLHGSWAPERFPLLLPTDIETVLINPVFCITFSNTAHLMSSLAIHLERIFLQA